ncbi:methylenetetrahydrofolate reductase [Candidatus Bathyarchaeota archaeon]|nr:methylenetetrahydrofolate reductase [Candidatus Bathyarchaeota archaeon]
MSRKSLSDLGSQLEAKEFTFTGELEPMKTTNLTHVIEAAKKQKGYVIACNVTDNPQSYAFLSGLATSYLVQEKTGMETIYQLTCRDRNRMALFSDILGAGALGIRNILALTGDHTTLGDTPQAKPVFDLDSVQLIHMIRRAVDDGVDLNGNPIESPPCLYIGAGTNPNAKPIEPELIKFQKKALAGADFFQTQVVFEIETAKRFLDEVRKSNVPVLVGIFPLKSYAIAEYFDKNVPGVRVPKELFEKLARAREIEDKAKRKEKCREINLDYFGGFIEELKQTTSAAGCHIMSVGYEEILPQLVKAVR